MVYTKNNDIIYVYIYIYIYKSTTTTGSDIVNPFPLGAMQHCLELKLCKIAFSLIIILCPNYNFF